MYFYEKLVEGMPKGQKKDEIAARLAAANTIIIQLFDENNIGNTED